MRGIPHTLPHDGSRWPLHGSAAYPAPDAPAETISGATRVGFVGTYGPRRCGIATFTADLALSIKATTIVRRQ